MIYLDTSALTKLLVAEAETPDLQSWLLEQRDHGEDHAVTSALGRVELMRAVARLGSRDFTSVHSICSTAWTFCR